MKPVVKITSILLIIIVLAILLLWLLNKPKRVFADSENPIGLEKQACWFDTNEIQTPSECFFMNVRENPNGSHSRIIKFPVVIFKTRFSTKPPLLHLGSGGPGAPMMLDDTEAVRLTLDFHDDMSINQRRDLILIDPRGTGLAQPLLNCRHFIKNQAQRFSQHLSQKDEYQQAGQDYRLCIEEFKSQGIQLNQYHSLSVVEDLEQLRIALDIEKWSIFGVSYAAIYAQLLAVLYPQTIESIILDSAAFVHLKEHQNFLINVFRPFQLMLNYCDVNIKCEQEPENLESDFWQLVNTLNHQPVTTQIPNPVNESSELEIVVSGHRLVESLIQGVYSDEIFYNFPLIIDELRNGYSNTLNLYLQSLALSYLENSYGDVSFITHYCSDTMPFTDYDLIHSKIQALAPGYLKENLELDMEWIRHCDTIGDIEKNPTLNQVIKTSIPTLFLQGKHDVITPLDDVQASLKHYKNHELIILDTAHDVISSDACGEVFAAEFLKNSNAKISEIVCESSY